MDVVGVVLGRYMALELATRELGDPWAVAYTQHHAGEAMFRQKRYAEAEALLNESLQAFERLDSPRSIIGTRYRLRGGRGRTRAGRRKEQSREEARRAPLIDSAGADVAAQLQARGGRCWSSVATASGGNASAASVKGLSRSMATLNHDPDPT